MMPFSGLILQTVAILLAAAVGLDAGEAHAMLAARTFKAAVDTDWARAYESRVTAVPTFLMSGQTLVGAQPFNVLENFMLQNKINRRPANH
jgi:predicted DsbA family dithiol-disulfide isomerase